MLCERERLVVRPSSVSDRCCASRNSDGKDNSNGNGNGNWVSLIVCGAISLRKRWGGIFPCEGRMFGEGEKMDRAKRG